MSHHTSNRQKKHLTKEGADALRQKPGWDPGNFQSKSPIEQLRELNQKEKSQEAYNASNTCAACSQAQLKQNDATALCDKHLAEAMGM